MAEQLPLPALLSQALVAFTIEFDNEAGHRTPHRTTSHSGPGDRGLWGAGERFGKAVIARLREDLETLAGDPAHPEASPLMRGLEPYPGNWRAEVRPPRALPHYPMVLHRGGFPDGS